MVDIAGIIKISCPHGTFLYAGTAFDADADIFSDIFSADGTHGANLRTMPAANAGITYLRLYLTNIDMRAMSVLWLEIGTNGVAPLHIRRSRIFPAACQLFRDFCAKFLHACQILCIRSACRKCFGKGMLAHKSTACNRPKAILLQNISQLNQRIIIIAVAEGNHGHRIRTVALYLLRQIGKQYIWHTPRNDRCAADN